jgi:hypothetical protein
LLLMCYFSKPRIPGAEYHRGEIYRAQALERLRHQRRETRLKDPKQRAEAIDAALIVKRIVASDEVTGQLILGEPDEAIDLDKQGSKISYHSLEETEEVSTCVICLDVFRVGDFVAWGKFAGSLAPRITEEKRGDDIRCRHVFHQECIAPWLQNPKHDDCPACRAMILPEPPEDTSDDALAEGGAVVQGAADDDRSQSSQYSHHTTGTKSVFVIVHGLISRVRRASSSLVGQTIGFCRMENDLDLHQPSRLRRVFSMGDGRIPDRYTNKKYPGRFSGSGCISADSQFHQKLATSSDNPHHWSSTIQLRRVVSAGPDSPARRRPAPSLQWRTRSVSEDEDETGSDQDALIPPLLPPPPVGVPFRRVSSKARSTTSVLEGGQNREADPDESDYNVDVRSDFSQAIFWDSALAQSMLAQDDGAIVQGGSFRPSRMPFRRVFSGTTCSALRRNSATSTGRNQWVRPSVSWRDLATSASERTEDDEEEDIMLEAV